MLQRAAHPVVVREREDEVVLTIDAYLILIEDRRPVARLDGRASAPQIERMLAPHLPPRARERAVAWSKPSSLLPRSRFRPDHSLGEEDG